MCPPCQIQSHREAEWKWMNMRRAHDTQILNRQKEPNLSRGNLAFFRVSCQKVGDAKTAKKSFQRKTKWMMRTVFILFAITYTYHPFIHHITSSHRKTSTNLNPIQIGMIDSCVTVQIIVNALFRGKGYHRQSPGGSGNRQSIRTANNPNLRLLCVWKGWSCQAPLPITVSCLLHKLWKHHYYCMLRTSLVV